MLIELKRYASDKDSTGGLLFVNGNFFCYTCEDEKREVKLAGETRIPEGSYDILLRNEGGMTKRYAARYDFHRGMIHLQNVPGFEWVYIHIGNTDDDTEGCLLVGYSGNRVKGENTVSKSGAAYSALYKKITAAMDAGETVKITIAGCV